MKERLVSPLKKVSYDYLLSETFITDLNQALLEMGPGQIKPQYRQIWSHEHPTWGYCYTITELIHHMKLGTTAMIIPSSLGYHRYTQLPDGRPFDPAKDYEYEYENGKPRPPMTPYMSKRTIILAGLMNLITP
jgi:hypothetical protein